MSTGVAAVSVRDARDLGITVAGPFHAPHAAEIWRRFAHLPYCLFLDSAASPSGELGRYSYITADPFRAHCADSETSGDTWQFLRQVLTQFSAPTIRDLPPFQGGVAGYLGFELARSLERLPRPAHDEFQLPTAGLCAYDTVVAVDQRQRMAWIVSSGFPASHPAERRRRSEARAKWFLELTTGAFDFVTRPAEGPVERSAETRCEARAAVLPWLMREQLVARELGSAIADGSCHSNLTPQEYLDMVGRAVEYIHAGDIFQVNLSQRLLTPATCSSIELYNRLRQCNPAPFAGYFDLGDMQILSASPERFLRLQGRQVETRPIKGTRPRTRQPEVDLFSADDLRASEKDVAENVMIVDLLRNDLSRVCEDDSVQVEQLCQVESYQFVQHLVSVVRGRLTSGLSGVDLLQASFPGGSITGAPKIRAMEIIAELEPTVRGPYCGSLAFWGFDGTMDSNILIRTVTSGRGWWQFPVGGGIVAQSEPQQEYQETWHKAAGILAAVRLCGAGKHSH